MNIIAESPRRHSRIWASQMKEHCTSIVLVCIGCRNICANCGQFCGLPLSGVQSRHHSFQWHVQTNEQPAFSLIAMKLGECKKKFSPKGGPWPTGPRSVGHCIQFNSMWKLDYTPCVARLFVKLIERQVDRTDNEISSRNLSRDFNSRRSTKKTYDNYRCVFWTARCSRWWSDKSTSMWSLYTVGDGRSLREAMCTNDVL